MECYRKGCEKKHICDDLMKCTCIFRETKEQAKLKVQIREQNKWVRCSYRINKEKGLKAKINTHTGEIEIEGKIMKWGHSNAS